jgi:hypothetical protein
MTLIDLFRRESVTTLFPAIKGELLVIARADDTTLVTSDLQDRDVDVQTFFTLAVWQILVHAHALGADPQHIINGVLRLGSSSTQGRS